MKNNRKINKIMQKWKKITIVSLLLVSILCVQVMETFADEPAPVQVSTWDELLAAVIASSDGDTIELMDAITVPCGVALNSTGKITLKRGNAQGCILTDWNINDDTLNSFENITFDGGELDGTEPILSICTTTQVTNCVFKDCKSVSGTVCINSGKVTFTGCSFKDNKGQTGSHVMVQSDKKVTITNCSFTGGQSGNNGGALFMGLNSCDVEVTGSTITGNTAANVGGAIYNTGTLKITSSKVYGNGATKGADIYSSSPVTTETLLTDLESIYEDENITVKGWLTENNEIGEVFMKLDYEVNTTPDPADDGSDNTASGNDSGSSDAGSGSDSGSSGSDGGSSDGSTEQPGTSTDNVSGNGSDTSQNPSEGTSTPSGNNSQGQGEQSTTEGTGSTQTPSGNTSNTESSSNTSNNTSNSTSSTTSSTSDSSDKSTTTSTTTSDSHNTSSTSNDNNSVTSTSTDTSDRSTTTSTDSSDHSSTSTTDDHSSKTSTTDRSKTTTNNYYQTYASSQKDSGSSSGDGGSTVINNTMTSPGSTGTQTSAAVEEPSLTSQNGSESTETKDPSNNISIDAEGVNVSFKVVDGVYSIDIKGNGGQTSGQVQEVVQQESTEKASSVNVYEIIKILMLAAILVTTFWKPRRIGQVKE